MKHKPSLGDTPVKTGMPVEMVTRKIHNDGDERGMLVYGYAQHPLRSEVQAGGKGLKKKNL